MTVIYKEIPIVKQEIAGFICCKCKTEFKEDDIFQIQEMLHMKDTGGYSSAWGDGTTYEVTLCDKCSYEMFKDIAIYHDA